MTRLNSLNRRIIMNQKLWDIIKLISERKEFGITEMTLASEVLDTDMFSILKEQVEKGLQMNSDQWV